MVDDVHLILDGYTRNSELMSSEEHLSKLLVQLVEDVEMQQISEPTIVNYRIEDSRNSGLSGVIFLAESSITIHTYPEYDFVFIDVFSCKPFDCKTVKQNLIDAFGLSLYMSHTLDRGILDGHITPARLRRR